jgi:hypothetical protein
MRPLIALGTILLFGQCSKNVEPVITKGTANIIINDTKTIDTLNTCYCWRTADSLAISIFRQHSFGGLSIDLTNKQGRHNVFVKYYSDYNEFNDKFELLTRLINDNISVTYDILGDSVQVTGRVNLETDIVDYFKDERKVVANGTFECRLEK